MADTTPKEIVIEVDCSRRLSTGNLSTSEGKPKVLSRYLSAPLDSCHIYCKFGMTGDQVENTRIPLCKRITSKEAQKTSHDAVRDGNLEARKKKSAPKTITAKTMDHVADGGLKAKKKTLTDKRIAKRPGEKSYDNFTVGNVEVGKQKSVPKRITRKPGETSGHVKDGNIEERKKKPVIDQKSMPPRPKSQTTSTSQVIKKEAPSPVRKMALSSKNLSLSDSKTKPVQAKRLPSSPPRLVGGRRFSDVVRSGRLGANWENPLGGSGSKRNSSGNPNKEMRPARPISIRTPVKREPSLKSGNYKTPNKVPHKEFKPVEVKVPERTLYIIEPKIQVTQENGKHQDETQAMEQNGKHQDGTQVTEQNDRERNQTRVKEQNESTSLGVTEIHLQQFDGESNNLISEEPHSQNGANGDKLESEQNEMGSAGSSPSEDEPLDSVENEMDGSVSSSSENGELDSVQNQTHCSESSPSSETKKLRCNTEGIQTTRLSSSSSPSPSNKKSLRDAPSSYLSGQGTENKKPRRAHKGFKLSPPRRLNFRRGKVLGVTSEKTSPRRLLFKLRKVLSDHEIMKDDNIRRSFQKVVDTAESGDSKTKTVNCVLRHHAFEGKKDSQSLLNNVIEETASKLVESRKSKVKALVGAFESVISLQDTKHKCDKSILFNDSNQG
ncbi:hypothetical protein NMG60_11009657 [Bertholletia excelsa]